MSRNRMGLVFAAATAFLAVSPSPAPAAFIEKIYTIRELMAESDVVLEGEVVQSDPQKKVFTARVVRAIKGKHPHPEVRVNLGVGFQWHPEVILKHAVPGAPFFAMYDLKGRGLIYINRFFFKFMTGPLDAPAERSWWSCDHLEIKMNRTFNGPAEALLRAVADAEVGKGSYPEPRPHLPTITRDQLDALPVWGKFGDAPLSPAFSWFDAKAPGTLRPPDRPSGAVPGLRFDYYERDCQEIPDFAALQPVAGGALPRFDLSCRKRATYYALRFTGYVQVPKDGVYTFLTRSTDGSKLLIGKDPVVLNDGLRHGAPPVTQGGDIALKAGKHAITVLFFQRQEAGVLEVLWGGPGVPRQPIPPEALFRTP